MKYRFKRGTTAENDALTEVAGTITIDTDKKQLRIHDGVTQGGQVVPNLDDVVALEGIIGDLSAGEPVFDYIGDFYRVDNVTHAVSELELDGSLSQGSEVLQFRNAVNAEALYRNLVLRNITDDDEVVIVAVNGSELEITPTTKPWSDGAELTTLSELDREIDQAVIMDISSYSPPSAQITALLAQLWVKEDGDILEYCSFKTTPVGDSNDYTKETSVFPQVTGRWNIASAILPVVNNRFSIHMGRDSTDISARIRVQGYYASI